MSGPEGTLQKQITQYLDAALPRLNAIYEVNTRGKFSRRVAGSKNGAPDLYIVHEGLIYPIELKAKGGVKSDAQTKRHAAYERAGAPVEIWRSLSDAEQFVASLGRKAAA